MYVQYSRFNPRACLKPCQCERGHRMEILGWGDVLVLRQWRRHGIFAYYLFSVADDGLWGLPMPSIQ